MRWEMCTLDLIFISAVCSVGWQKEQIPLWGVREAFYNQECARGEVAAKAMHAALTWACLERTGFVSK